MSDPWEVLGLSPGASLSEARAARRRLAKQLHPDVHGARRPEERAELERRMTRVNQALAAIVATIPAPGPLHPGPPHPGSADPGSADPGLRPDHRAGPERAQSHYPVAPGVDADTLCIEALPAQAFEALFVVAYGLGEILDEDEPYRLDLYLSMPEPCFCHLDVVPDAGGSIVTISVSAAEEADAPPVAAVRDLLVVELNALASRERTR